jgi:hypothetical protein
MNAELLARARAEAGIPTAGGVEAGRAFVVQVEPDLAARERINVGVCVIAPDGRRQARFIADYRRLEHLYGREVAELIEVLADFARAAVLSGDTLGSPSVSFTDAQPFFGVQPEQYLDQLFVRMVPAAAPVRDAKGEVEEPRSTDTLWREVGNVIKLRIPDRAEEILAGTPWTEVETQRGRRQVCVPLQPVGAAGALESADFSPGVTERKLMRALLDVEAAWEAKQLKRMGLFIARPRRARRDEDLRAIDKAIDYVACRAPRLCRVEVEADVAQLASHIIDWADLRAA